MQSAPIDTPEDHHVSHPEDEQPDDTSPAQRADAAHYLTRHLAQALRRVVFQSEEMAFAVAHEVVEDLSQRIPGQALRVPQISAPAVDQEAIARRLINRRADMSFDMACRREGVSLRTGYRLVAKYRPN